MDRQRALWLSTWALELEATVWQKRAADRHEGVQFWLDLGEVEQAIATQNQRARNHQMARECLDAVDVVKMMRKELV